MNGSCSHCKPRRRPQVTSGTSQFIRAAPHQIEVLCFSCSFYALGLCGLHERCHETDIRVRLMQGLLLYAQSLLCFIGKCNRTHSVTHKQIYDLKLATITNNRHQAKEAGLKTVWLYLNQTDLFFLSCSTLSVQMCACRGGLFPVITHSFNWL